VARKGSIEDVGIKDWVDQNSPEHLNYSVFRRMREAHASIASMARTFGKTENIMRKWIVQDDLENGKPA